MDDDGKKRMSLREKIAAKTTKSTSNLKQKQPKKDESDDDDHDSDKEDDHHGASAEKDDDGGNNDTRIDIVQKMNDGESENEDGKAKDDNEDDEEEEDEFMKDFFREVKEVKQGMSVIRRNIRTIEETWSNSLHSVNADEGKRNSEQLEVIVDSTNLAASEVRNKLKDMDEQNKAMVKSNPKVKGSAQWRIRTNTHGSLTRKFMDLMQEYQELQTIFKNKFKERVERQYKIAKPDATQEEIEEALESGDTEIFAQQILETKRHSKAKDALAYVEAKHRDILRLEQSIKELHQLFLDMAILVESQGELINQIEYNVSSSVEYTKEAVEELKKANKLQKKSRKKMCIIIVILIIVFIIAGFSGLLGGLFK